MNILQTMGSYYPIGGAQEVVKQISERLVRRGHEVTVATSWQDDRASKKINGVQIAEFKVSGNAIHGFQGEVDRYQEFLLEGDFDVMMNYAAQQWATDLVLPILKRLPYYKVFAPCGFSGLFEPEYIDYFQRMPDFLKQYDHVIFHSERYRDIDFARKHGLSNFTVIPNGAGEEEFGQIDSTFRQKYGISEDVPLLLTVGSHTGLKGHGLVMRAFSRAEIGKSVLIIIGNFIPGTGCQHSCELLAQWVKLKSLGRRRVLLLNPPRSDVVAAYHAVDLFIFGSNIECSPLVLFEAMASRTPFITIACGNAEEIVEWGHGGVTITTIKRTKGSVGADPAVMANAIEGLINNPNELQRLADAGYRAWKDRFMWEKIALEYERVYKSLLDQD
jgi:glycosyltransferase involved in cell wall biosynthesis